MKQAINRRIAIRNLLIIAGGTMVLPACFRESGKSTIKLTNLSVSEEDEHLLAELTETIIPASDSPGGKDLLLHLFVLKMVDDCHSPEDQQVFSQGLSLFVSWSEQQLGKPYLQASPSDRVALLSSISESGKEKIVSFFGILKRRTIQGYMNSQYVMTNLVKYELIPGRYNGYAKAI